jgi:hypothetical protein
VLDEGPVPHVGARPGIDANERIPKWCRMTRQGARQSGDLLDVVQVSGRGVGLSREPTRDVPMIAATFANLIRHAMTTSQHPLVDALEREIREHVFHEMPSDPSGELRQMQLADLLIVFGTWRSRLIPARPRTVHVSEELNGAVPQEHQAAFDAIIKKIRGGDDLTSHLSAQVSTAYVPTAEARKIKKHRLRDRDLLIADWGIHHLHLGTALRSDGFTERTRDLLFAFFANNDAYLINIYRHGDWALKAIAEICVSNWPHAGIFTLLPGLTGLSQQYKEEDRLPLRNAGVAQLLEIGGNVYRSRMQTTAGTPLKATLRANDVHWKLQDLRDQPNLEAILTHSARGQGSGAWRPFVADDHYGFAREGNRRVRGGDVHIVVGRLG